MQDVIGQHSAVDLRNCCMSPLSACGSSTTRRPYLKTPWTRKCGNEGGREEERKFIRGENNNSAVLPSRNALRMNQTLAATGQRFWITRGQVIRTCMTYRRSAGNPFHPKMDDVSHFNDHPWGTAFLREMMHVCIFTCMVVSVIHLMISVRYDDPHQKTLKTSSSYLYSTTTDERRCHSPCESIERNGISSPTELLAAGASLIERSAQLNWLTDAEEQTLRTVLGEIKARINNELLAVISHKQLCRRQRGVDTCSFLYRKGIIVTAKPKQHRQWWYQRKLLEHLCTRWKREYLVTLSSKGNWRKLIEEPRIGDVVLMMESNLFRN
ncbi:hypothetical protein T4C_3766 [Trichinella pseudospiralis]|uniref:DUF5641 domain-containing protein n=2 Tax=Trichinella pseudospiralis TaxID=6337 RepID=A0A0V1JZ15_TRIPS|nr:hypothetical protein T4C_3766 [Trichinella pseudospiralis]